MHDIGTFIWAAVVIIGIIASQVKKLRDAKPPSSAVEPPDAGAPPAAARNAMLAQRAAAARAAMAVQPALSPAPAAAPVSAPIVQPIAAPLLSDAPSIADIDRQMAVVRPVLPLGLGATDGARRAVVLMEILGPPVALR